jgi:nucleotide-binding universal stress UspA family protein
MKKRTLGFGEITVEEIQKRPRCFIGCHETLIAASEDGHRTDPFFQKSVTYYGSGRNGNVALNSRRRHQQSFDPGDNTTGEEVYKYSDTYGGIIRDFFNTEILKILREDPGTLFMTWSQEHWSLFAEEFHRNVICANDCGLVALIGNKKNFKEFAKGKLPQADFDVIKGAEIRNLLKQRVFPDEREVVVQSQQGILGVGTSFFTKGMQKDRIETLSKEINPEELYVVSEYVHNIGSPSVCALVSNNETAIYPPWMMAIDKNSGSTAGSDLAAFAALPVSARQAVKDAALKAAKVLQESGYRGTANIDLIVTTGEKHPEALITEINARDPETIALLTVAANKAGFRSPHELKAEAHYAERSDFAGDVNNIPPIGRKIYGSYTRGADGKVVIPPEHRHRNTEGLDQTDSEDDIEGTTRLNYTYTGFIF